MTWERIAKCGRIKVQGPQKEPSGAQGRTDVKHEGADTTLQLETSSTRTADELYAVGLIVDRFTGSGKTDQECPLAGPVGS